MYHIQPTLHLYSYDQLLTAKVDCETLIRLFLKALNRLLGIMIVMILAIYEPFRIDGGHGLGTWDFKTEDKR